MFCTSNVKISKGLYWVYKNSMTKKKKKVGDILFLLICKSGILLVVDDMIFFNEHIFVQDIEKLSHHSCQIVY